MKKVDMPFIYGAQYYRAPTPEQECWEEDLRHMRQLGFNSVKFWVQWRWSERSEGIYYWKDLDLLMELAAENQLHVTLNLILDVAPDWLFKKYPDAMMVDASGKICQPCANICRQLGGYPGPCYHHPGALAARQRFVIAAIQHFSPHPALAMWDVWNEPENNLMVRMPEAETLFCHCSECRIRFIPYLQQKYRDIEHLNTVWGRCYCDWNEVEVPTQAATIADFIDWREFHLDKLTAEADWRLNAVRTEDPGHIRYLHVVANSVNCFNSITCVDDFDLARNCQVFGSTMMSSPLFCSQAVSAAQGKVFYNAECHINYGSTAMHQRIIDLPLFLKEILPQLGWGVRGFLFWQFRAETLGLESPAWGLVRPDGSKRPVTDAVEEFGQRLRPWIPQLMACPVTPPPIGIWRGRRNEIFQFAINQLPNFAESLSCYAETLYRLNLPFRTISSRQLLEGSLGDLKMLVMVDAYCLDEQEAQALDAWLRAGGVILSDAHLAAYNGTLGRHSRRTPGCGLAESWGLMEEESTSSFHLPLAGRDTSTALAETQGDVAKALSSTGASGSEFFPLTSSVDLAGLGGRRFAVMAGEQLKVEAEFQGRSCIVSKNIGKGKLFYAGTSLGGAAGKDDRLLKHLLLQAAGISGINRMTDAETVHVDILYDRSGQPQFAVIFNRTAERQQVTLGLEGHWHGLFSETVSTDGTFVVDPDTAELYVKEIVGKDGER